MNADEPRAPERILILGASGFIGSRLLEHLTEQGRAPVVGMTSATCNLLSLDETRRAMTTVDQQTALVFCAAIGRLQDDSWEATAKNITMAHNVATALHSTTCRSMIFLSSTDIYGVPPAQLPITEDTPPVPSSHYGIAKLTSEHILRMQLGTRTPITMLRLPGIFGRGDNFRSVVGRFVRTASLGQPITLTGDGMTLRDYVSVEDLSGIVDFLLARPSSRVVNVATGQAVPIRTIAELTMSALGSAAAIRFVPREGRDSNLTFDTRRLQATCPEMKLTSLEGSIRRYIAGMSCRAKPS
jgi:nucleoside-diphosphate-sugar epimerase